MSDNDDFFGGIYDLDGDGKTDWSEMSFALSDIEEAEKAAWKNNAASFKRNNVIRGEGNSGKGNVGSHVLTGLIVCFVTGLFLYGAICAYERGSGVGFAFVLITALVFVTALVFSVKMIAESISNNKK